MGGMMNGMGMGMSMAMMLACVLLLLVLVLVAAAAIKYLFFDKARRGCPSTTSDASDESRRAQIAPATGVQAASAKAR